eukprot:4523607-Ditylum_brightwellii.AAC.1
MVLSTMLTFHILDLVVCLIDNLRNDAPHMLVSTQSRFTLQCPKTKWSQLWKEGYVEPRLSVGSLRYPT